MPLRTPENQMVCKQSVTLSGIAFSLKNSRKMVINPRTKRPMFITNPKAKVELAGFISQLKAWWGDRPFLPAPVAIRMVLYYPDRRHDGSDGIIKDPLQAAGVVENDRHIYSSSYRKAFDPKHPRVELWVGPMPVE